MLVAFTYLVTKDLVKTIENKCQTYINGDLSFKIGKLEDDFLCKFWQCIPLDCKKTAFGLENLKNNLYLSYKQEQLPCISLDQLYAPCTLVSSSPWSALDLSVTRITNPITGRKQLGARPGKKPIDAQIDDIAREYKKIALVDCGAFEGDTLVEIIDRFNLKGVIVGCVYLAISSYSAKDKISKKCDTKVNNLFNFKDWVELRDLFGIDGRKVSEVENAFIPYWENLSEWASISKNKEQCASELCQKYNALLLELLAESGYPIDGIGKTVKCEWRK